MIQTHKLLGLGEGETECLLSVYQVPSLAACSTMMGPLWPSEDGLNQERLPPSLVHLRRPAYYPAVPLTGPGRPLGLLEPRPRVVTAPALLACCIPRGPGDQAWGCHDCLTHMVPCKIRGPGGCVPVGTVYPSTGPTTLPRRQGHGPPLPHAAQPHPGSLSHRGPVDHHGPDHRLHPDGARGEVRLQT